MLILVEKGEKPKGFFLKRKAKQGKLPPTVVGIQLGKYPCALLRFYGDITPGNGFLAPYIRRGDIIIPSQNLKKLGFGEAYLEEFTRRQCVNGVKEWVANHKQRAETVLYDPTGECVGVAAEFCSLGGPLWVVTPKEEIYAPCAEYALLEFGNPPMIGKRIPPCGDLVIAPYGIPSPELSPDIPVVAPGHIWAKREDLTLPKEIAHSTPKGFDPILVAAGCFAMFGAGMECEAVLRSDIFAFGKSDMLPTQRDIFPTER